jgi:hypothetical protein
MDALPTPEEIAIITPDLLLKHPNTTVATYV